LYSSDPIPLVDKLGRIFAVLAGQPRDDKYAAAVSNAYHFIKTQGAASHFPTSMRHHHRGLFAAINVGLTYGKGQCVPTWLDNKEYTGLAAQLLANKDIRRMAHFASCTPTFPSFSCATLNCFFSCFCPLGPTTSRLLRRNARCSI
jgi:hypothetical protein